jgi:DNA-binding NtrC family response regulator
MIKNIIAVVDDSPVELNIFSNYVKRMGNEPIKINKGLDIVDCFVNNKKIQGHSYRDIDLILLNLFMADISGIDILEKIKDRRGNTPVIIITGSTDKSLAIKTIALGAYDFIVKGDKEIFTKLSNSILNAIKKKNIKYKSTDTNLRVGNSVAISDIVTQSKIMENVILTVKKSISSMIPVFISGEDGSGRELIAKIIHDSSIRFKYPFSTIDCKNLAPNNIDKILYGYIKKDRNCAEKTIHGKIKGANRGTLYIENIDLLPYNTQTKLLNFLQHGEIEIYDSIKLYTADTRIIASSSKNIDELLKDKSYNNDLLEKFNNFPIAIPNLRERGADDIILLANNFCNTFSLNENKNIKGLSKDAINLLINHQWDHNIKQLRNVLLKAVILCDDEYLNIQHFPSLISDRKNSKLNISNDNKSINLFHQDGRHKTLAEIQREIISKLQNDFKYKPQEILKHLNIKPKISSKNK